MSYYKSQKILSRCGKTQGYEILLDSKQMQDKEYQLNLNRLKSDYRYVIDFLSGLFVIVSELLYGEYIFINIEPSHLLEWELINKIVKVNNEISNAQRRLVIEITERIRDNNTISQLPKALAFLKSKGVLIAIDDFEGVEDKRFPLLQSCEIDFIKVEFETFFLSQFSHDQNVRSNPKIVIERVESIKDYMRLSHSEVWGLQGFLFCKGQSIRA